MTAEIAVLNTAGVALAADSAVTISTRGGPKIYNTVNKLFTLSKIHPVGVMIYGSADFMYTPWELIIKTYRAKLGSGSFGTIGEYGADFIRFLESSHDMFSPEIQQIYLQSLFEKGFRMLRGYLDDAIEDHVDEHGQVTDREIVTLVKAEISEALDTLAKNRNLKGITPIQAKELVAKNAKALKGAIQKGFENYPLDTSDKSDLRTIATLFLHKNIKDLSGLTGVVFAGYGEKEHFPALHSFSFEGIAGGYLRYHEGQNATIDRPGAIASIVPFAQGEMVSTFMEGIDPSYKDVLAGFLDSVIRHVPDLVLAGPGVSLDNTKKNAFEKYVSAEAEKLLAAFEEGIERYSQRKFADPIVELTASLPKDELAAMAEALVNLTSFKRKVSPETETVGGPIDVAVISKGDGFIWIKRKHYFDVGLNPHFTANYFRDCREDA